MTRLQKIELWTASLLTILLTASAFMLVRWRTRQPVVLQGAITVQDADTRKERPVAEVQVTAEDGRTIGKTESDSTGFFTLKLDRSIRRGHPILLHFRHDRYQPLDLKEYVGDKLYVVHMISLTDPAASTPQSEVKVGSGLRVRYSINAMSEVNVGSAVKTFQIENKGNTPCKGQHPCSPDGKWKAALGSASLDAGLGNEFRDARASCIAGPCPFTRIESDQFSQGGQVIKVSARDWSDTTTFLLEAEVFHPMVSQIVHESYPVIFGDGLNFTLPASAEGVSIEAELDGQTIIFPLGPALLLSWANCNARVNSDQTRVYRCDLKPGYRFQ
jgi:hypothetical protein